MADLTAYFLLGLRALMALTLYGFLGWCFLTLWRELNQQASNLARQRVPALLVTQEAGGQQLRFSTPEVTLGRHPSCEWVLDDDTVSSRHARLVFHHDHWWLEDLGSRNGTFLNGDALRAPVVLTNQDRIRCGQVNFALQIEALSQTTYEQDQP
ncbi:MAG TPA: FHA domain-containing protein [Anaerolineales bacterium]|nr:FHA domain-containing protein [Anaerolineales bacterium]HRQ91993.1 FHA domain-containing protein [Anaerolineales bacterium]